MEVIAAVRPTIQIIICIAHFPERSSRASAGRNWKISKWFLCLHDVWRFRLLVCYETTVKQLRLEFLAFAFSDLHKSIRRDGPVRRWPCRPCACASVTGAPCFVARSTSPHDAQPPRLKPRAPPCLAMAAPPNPGSMLTMEVRGSAAGRQNGKLYFFHSWQYISFVLSALAKGIWRQRPGVAY